MRFPLSRPLTLAIIEHVAKRSVRLQPAGPPEGGDDVLAPWDDRGAVPAAPIYAQSPRA